MPIENAKKQWPEDESPYVTVGKDNKAQDSWNQKRSAAVDKADDI